MKKIEQIFREILFQAMENKKMALTQSELARTLEISLSTVNLAVQKLAGIGAVIVELRKFRIIDIRKVLYYWASVRNLQKDIAYSTRVEMSVHEIEKNLPNVLYACFLAYKFNFKDVPADYSEVYIYAFDDELAEIKRRFPENRGIPNLIVLKADNSMKRYSKTISLGQVYVDLWNLKQWYAKDFLDSFEGQLQKLGVFT